MKEYTSKSPTFSDSIMVTEVTDPAHADNINAAPKQLLQNTMVLKTNEENMNEMFTEQIAEAMKSIQKSDNLISAVQDSMLQTAMILATISDANRIDASNLLVETFVDTSDIIITSGMFDSSNHRLYA